jgi:hypothetical protein
LGGTNWGSVLVVLGFRGRLLPLPPSQFFRLLAAAAAAAAALCLLFSAAIVSANSKVSLSLAQSKEEVGLAET